MALSYAEHLLRRWEREDRNRPNPPPSAPQPYATPQSTIDAFWYLVRLGEKDRLDNWLRDRPFDSVFLLEQKRLKDARHD